MRREGGKGERAGHGSADRQGSGAPSVARHWRTITVKMQQPSCPPPRQSPHSRLKSQSDVDRPRGWRTQTTTAKKRLVRERTEPCEVYKTAVDTPPSAAHEPHRRDRRDRRDRSRPPGTAELSPPLAHEDGGMSQREELLPGKPRTSPRAFARIPGGEEVRGDAVNSGRQDRL